MLVASRFSAPVRTFELSGTDSLGETKPFFDHPILNSPYEYPRRHWELDETGQSTQTQACIGDRWGRRLAHAWMDGIERGHGVEPFDPGQVPAAILAVIRRTMASPAEA
jgi:hypothetical protein